MSFDFSKYTVVITPGKQRTKNSGIKITLQNGGQNRKPLLCVKISRQVLKEAGIQIGDQIAVATCEEREGLVLTRVQSGGFTVSADGNFAPDVRASLNGKYGDGLFRFPIEIDEWSHLQFPLAFRKDEISLSASRMGIQLK